MMHMTTDPDNEGWGYWKLRVVRGGCCPWDGAPGSSPIDNAYRFALIQMEYQALCLGADGVIDLHVIRYDEAYVLVAGTAIKNTWVDYNPVLRQREQQQREKPGRWKAVLDWVVRWAGV